MQRVSLASTQSPGFHRLSIVIPAFNEADSVGHVIAALRKAMPEAEIIVVDDGSTDRTLEAVLPYDGVVVLQHLFNRGYGASLKSGMEAATREFVAWFDADSEHRVEDLAGAFSRIENSALAAVIGQRSNGSTSNVRSIGKLAIRLLARALNIKAGHDLNCGLRIFRRTLILSYVHLLPDRYSASLTTTLLLIQRNYPFEFHPVSSATRIGTSKVVLRDGVAAMTKVLEVIMLTAPMRIFFRLGALLFVVGVIYSLTRGILERQGLPVAGTFTMILGILFCLLGLIADQISHFRLGQIRVDGLVRHVQSRSKASEPDQENIKVER